MTDAASSVVLDCSCRNHGRAGVRRPVRQACQEQTNADASLTIRTKTDGDPDWKKGVQALSRRSIGTHGGKTASPDEADH